jgi:hypothetical protein
MVRAGFPSKKVKVIAPPGRMHSKELWALAHQTAKISEEHLEMSLLPEKLLDAAGAVICTRPTVWAPSS